MAFSFPYNIVNGTDPDATEVMGNFTAVGNQFNRMFIVEEYSSSNSNARTNVGTTTSTIPGTSVNFSVAVPSILLISYYSRAVHAWTLSKTTQVVGKIEPTLNGSTVGDGAQFEHYVIDAGDGGSARVPVHGSQIIGLTVGAHTIALQYTNTVGTGGGWCSIQMQGGGWSGLVIPS